LASFSTTAFQSTSPTSSVFSISTPADVNGSGSTYVAYCFSEVAGYSKFGSYTGNGSTDGVFIHLGFSPKFLLVKNTSDTGYGWNLVDTSRDTYNVANKRLMPQASNAEDTGSINFDLLSNGFKIRDGGTGINASGATYIYMAFASVPAKFSLGK